jgi:hypothetical protein
MVATVKSGAGDKETSEAGLALSVTVC